jgi:dUTP pyrophosphatase
MEIKFYLKDELAIAPLRASADAAGYDLFAHSMGISNEDPTLLKVGTGVHVQIPKGFFGLLTPRSSIYKKKQILYNSVGIVDSDYRGEIMMVFKDVSGGSIDLSKEVENLGQRLGQILILPLPHVTYNQVNSIDELSSTERGEGGFGSTGLK